MIVQVPIQPRAFIEVLRGISNYYGWTLDSGVWTSWLFRDRLPEPRRIKGQSAFPLYYHNPTYHGLVTGQVVLLKPVVISCKVVHRVPEDLQPDLHPGMQRILDSIGFLCQVVSMRTFLPRGATSVLCTEARRHAFLLFLYNISERP
jgi:hypothetical protein